MMVLIQVQFGQIWQKYTIASNLRIK